MAVTIQNGTATAKTSDGLKALTSEDLGGGFAADTNGINSGYPVLAWQNGTVKSDDPEKDDNGWQGEAAKDAPQQKDGVYQIGTPEELAWFAEKAKQDSTDLKAVLTADLDLNNNVWTGIGGQTADTGFAGTLDGAGHTIKNLYLKNGKGLIPYNKGTVKNLTLEGLLKGGDETARIDRNQCGNSGRYHFQSGCNGRQQGCRDRRKQHQGWRHQRLSQYGCSDRGILCGRYRGI